MANDTQNVLTIVDGGGIPRNILIAVDSGGTNRAYQMVPRTRGAMVDDTNPLPVRSPSVAPVASSVLESFRILSAAPCSVFAIQVNPTLSGYVMLFDAVAKPSDGAVSPVKVWRFNASDLETVDKVFNTPLKMLNGAVLVFSTTGPLTLTASATAQFSGEAA